MLRLGILQANNWNRGILIEKWWPMVAVDPRYHILQLMGIQCTTDWTAIGSHPSPASHVLAVPTARLQSTKQYREDLGSMLSTWFHHGSSFRKTDSCTARNTFQPWSATLEQHSGCSKLITNLRSIGICLLIMVMSHDICFVSSIVTSLYITIHYMQVITCCTYTQSCSMYTCEDINTQTSKQTNKLNTYGETAKSTNRWWKPSLLRTMVVSGPTSN